MTHLCASLHAMENPVVRLKAAECVRDTENLLVQPTPC